MNCFPNFALFVTCCPHAEVATPRDNGCPERYMPLVETCCTTPVTNALLDALGWLSPNEIGAADNNDYISTVGLVGHHLQRFVRDRDLWHKRAWRLLAIASAAEAVARSDRVKDATVKPHGESSRRKLLDEARAVSRQLAKALYRLGNFQQFAISHKALHTEKMILSMQPEEVRDDFQPALKIYERVADEHNFLAYQLIPALEDTFPRQLARPPVDGPVVNLLVVSLGLWAKTGFNTIWSMVHFSSVRLRIFVMGDPQGLQAWRDAVRELTGQDSKKIMAGVKFEYIDFAAHPGFRALLRRYPKDCTFGEAGKAILARVVSHVLLPPDVDRVISMDLGDILVLDDIRGLWDVGDTLDDHHLMAAADAVALHHMNGGLVVYNIQRMRERNFTPLALKVARMGLKVHGDGNCLRDQSIINILHTHRKEYGFSGPSPVMALPCKWSLFPTTDWAPHWNSPEKWLPELRERHRYPGFVSKSHFELYCPDEVDMLSSWAFIPVSEGRQSRIRTYAHHRGMQKQVLCSQARKSGRCCKCGEKASLIHVPGDLKKWQSVYMQLFAYMPPWLEMPKQTDLSKTSSRVWWGGADRTKMIEEGTEKLAHETARSLGLQVVFERCVTVNTGVEGMDALSYHATKLKVHLPIDLQVETTAAKGAHVLVGLGSRSGLEVVMGAHKGGEGALLRWVHSAPGWTTRGELFNVEHHKAQDRMTVGPAGLKWAKFRVKIAEDGAVEVSHDEVVWGIHVPENLFHHLRKTYHLTLSLASEAGTDVRWYVCG
eukprot:TRINITY_DN59472_c0_g1_i1.p1 TRINITY_DN59472_c0_g1~~TRINITY_DN59472_c0_g1_i1.p1  ORF type:complete len:773 (-),score=95.50 TRINITY_DN59472_c0_g1_i1:200-2518(-)